MLPHITRQSIFPVDHSMEPLAIGDGRLKDPSRVRAQRGVHALGADLRRIILHATILSIAVLASVVGAMANWQPL